MQLCLTSIFKGKYLRNNLTQDIFNNEIANNYIEDVKINKNVTFDLLISGLAYAYCDDGDKNKAIKLIDDFIKKFPNNSIEILTKSNIYINEDESDYEIYIAIIKDSLKNDNIDSKYALFGSLALLYEKI